MEITDDLRDELRSQMRRRGWSQAELASRAGVAERTVWAMMRGESVRQAKLEAVQTALGLRVGVPEPSWLAAMVRHRVDALATRPEAQERYIRAVVWITALDAALLPERPEQWTGGGAAG